MPADTILSQLWIGLSQNQIAHVSFTTLAMVARFAIRMATDLQATMTRSYLSTLKSMGRLTVIRCIVILCLHSLLAVNYISSSTAATADLLLNCRMCTGRMRRAMSTL